MTGSPAAAPWPHGNHNQGARAVHTVGPKLLRSAGLGRRAQASRGLRGAPHSLEAPGGARLILRAQESPPPGITRPECQRLPLKGPDECEAPPGSGASEFSDSELGTKLSERLQRPWAAGLRPAAGAVGLPEADRAWPPQRAGLLETPLRNELMLDASAPWAPLPGAKTVPETR